jgi:deoxyribodipyrimidine photo-lyase
LSLLENIHNIKVFVGEFSDLLKHLKTDQIIYREHPLNKNYQGREEPREWMSSIKGYFPSFFAFWKKCKKELMTS